MLTQELIDECHIRSRVEWLCSYALRTNIEFLADGRIRVQGQYGASYK